MERLNWILKSFLAMGIWVGAGACGFSLLAQPGKTPSQPVNKSQPSLPGQGQPQQKQGQAPAANSVPNIRFGRINPSGTTTPTINGISNPNLAFQGFNPYMNPGNPSAGLPGSFTGFPSYPGMVPGGFPGPMNPYANNPFMGQNTYNPFLQQMQNPFNFHMQNPYMMGQQANWGANNQWNMQNPMNPFANNPFNMANNPALWGAQPNFLGGNAPVVGVGFLGGNGPPLGGVPFNPALGFRP
jgi:hypothetical protein